MKVFVKKEFPLHKPSKDGFYTCEIDPEYNSHNLDKKHDIYFNYLLDRFEFKGDEVKILFFYEETDAYVPKTKYEKQLEEEIKLLDAKIHTLTDRIFELEIMSPPSVIALEEKYQNLHAIVHKLVDILETPHTELHKVRDRLTDLGFPVKGIY